MGQAAPPPTEEFVQLFTANQRRLYLFILPQVATTQDADEVLQETNLVIWNKYQQFSVGTNFFAWAAQIATYEVLKHRQRRYREKLQFNDEFVNLVAAEAAERGDELEQRRRALQHCLSRLRAKDRKLIQMRYRPGESGKALAAELGRPANSVYQSLGRIRRSLLECINRRLAAEAGA
ncbi:MAG: RNA polymerase subunit sigma [Planctomycetota bacterium]|nr:MAG: RNA polymerase subunit sigma [Planctomycetota bacterium]REJ95570.1 MAG: RNA polymerase subunit sigma [Planctomycetota bacterium]REK21962.1 MAG: RNA polymerase subunit sigma [Planctomycetota bacterium]REK32188.1 MAG: RNA polymerase subunit sigma [Planctomycetota bacterium]